MSRDPGSRPADFPAWAAMLLADAHDIAALRIDDGVVREANAAARRLFDQPRLAGLPAARLCDDSCRDKLQAALEAAAPSLQEIQVAREQGPPRPVQFCFLPVGAGERLLLAAARDAGYSEQVGEGLIALNTQLADALRELSRRTRALEAARHALERDIAERRRVEEALRQSETHFRKLFEQAPDGIFIADLDGSYTDVNTAGCRMLGYSRDELLGMKIVDLIPPGEVSRLAEDRRLLGEQGNIQISEWTLRRKDGVLLPVEVSATILPDGRWQAFVRDITERRRSEQQQRFLAEAGTVLAGSLDYEETITNIARLTVRHIADLCIIDVLDESGEVRRLAVVHADPARAAACEGLARSAIDRRRPHLTRRAILEQRSALWSEVTPEFLEAHSQGAEHLRLLRELDLRSVIAVPMLASGRTLGALVLASSHPSLRYGPRDLAAAEELARRAALAVENARLYRAAQRATRARDEVLGIVAHDLRSPLSAVDLAAQLLRKQLRERGAPGAVQSVETILRSLRRANRLIEDLLDVTRIEAGRLSVERDRLPPLQLILDAVEAQRLVASSSSIELRFDVERALPAVWADRDRLLQVFENLLGNAIKFTGPGGRVTIGAAPGAGEVRFWVADTGPGIPTRDLPHVFDRFWQARRAERRGAGLGLPICKGLVEAHGGRIWVESTLGHGTTFCFTIPVSPDFSQTPGSSVIKSGIEPDTPDTSRVPSSQ